MFKQFLIIVIFLCLPAIALSASVSVSEMGLLTLAINLSVSMLLLYALVSLRQSKKQSALANQKYDQLESQIEEISRLNTRLQKENTTDGLTRVGNRSHFEITYKMEWDRAHRENKPIAMLMIDIDKFKLVNDQYGHTVGDQCLIAVALAIRGCLHRSSDRLMRYGGEEFAVLLNGTDIDGVRLMSERILQSVRSLEFQQGFTLTVSIGGASMIPNKVKNGQCFVRLVDEALYRAKDRGRDRVEVVEEPSVEVLALR